MKEKFLILAYPGLGKSWVAEHYKNVSDFEFQHYRYDYGQYKNLPLEQLKGKTSLRTPNSEWPQNFFAALNSEIENVDIVMVPFSTTVINNLNLLNKMVKIIIVLPCEDSFNKFAKIYKNRGNSDEFIERRRQDFYKTQQVVKDLPYKVIILERQEFLIDAIRKLGCKLYNGVGRKNYK